MACTAKHTIAEPCAVRGEQPSGAKGRVETMSLGLSSLFRYRPASNGHLQSGLGRSRSVRECSRERLPSAWLSVYQSVFDLIFECPDGDSPPKKSGVHNMLRASCA